MKPVLQSIFLGFALTVAFQTTVQAQQSYALKPYAITLPRVTTTQQVNPATVPQQAGNVVYNTTEQKVAVSTGADRFGNGQWQYLSAGTIDNREFKNAIAFSTTAVTRACGTTATGPCDPVATYNFIVPAGVTRFLVELWGGGEGGGKYQPDAPPTYCTNGGQAGGYVRKYVDVVAGETIVSIVVGSAGSGIRTLYSGLISSTSGPFDGQNSFISYARSTLTAFGGSADFGPRSGTDNLPGIPAIMIPGHGPGPISLETQQRSSTRFDDVIKASDGGLAYGTLLGPAGQGMLLRYEVGSDSPDLTMNETFATGSFPGGGGGCGYRTTSTLPFGFIASGHSGQGGFGYVIIRW
ncbi:MAG: hypothetical protein EAZ91_21155 [Cytophagales bacterium]|nr:MAG: hypothetical protein EAZ91_21155 [Cytophagales bacterium]